MKNRLIDKLLKVAKEHKILTYPVLAFVAIISFFSYFFSWSQGAGKRVFAIIMVMVMLVSQSYFLTSSATALVDDEEAALVQKELQEASDDEEQLINAEPQEQPTENVTEATTSVATETVTEAATEVQEEAISQNSGTPATETSWENSQTTETAYEEEEQDSEEDENFGEEENIDSKLDTESSTVQYIFYYQDDNSFKEVGNASGKVTSETKDENGEFVYDLSSKVPDINKITFYTNDGCYEFSKEWYTDSKFVNKVTDFKKVKAKKNSAGNDSIYLYCKRTLVKYKVTLVEHNDTKNPKNLTYKVTDGELTQEAGIYRIPIGSDMEITDISRTGYSFSGAEVAGGTVSSSTDTSVTVNFNTETATKQVILNWTAKEYTITYAKDENGTVGKTQTVTYDGTEKFLDGEDFVAEKEGWKFKGWKIGTDGTEVSDVATVSDYQDQLYQQGDIALYPVYTYDGFMLAQEEVRYQYKVPSTKNTLIQARYADSNVNGSSNFVYEIKSGADDLEGMGIEVKETSSGITIKTDGPTSTTGDANPIKLVIAVTDKTAPAEEQTKEFTVYVYVEKCKVTITAPEGDTVKTYDGTDTANLKSPLSVKVGDMDVKVEFSGCHYNSANVSEADKIILEDPKLVLPTDENSTNYELTNDSVAGSINKRPVYLKTSAVLPDGRSYIRAGEQNPEFKAEEYTKYNSSSIGLVDGDSVESLGVVFSTTRPTDLTVEGEYSISAEAAADANYEVLPNDSIKGTFKVIQEVPNEHVNYEILGTKGNQNWYIKNPVQIKPVNNWYDTIRISKDGSTVYTSGSLVDISEEEFPKGTTLYIQLYDSVTGAVTSWGTLNINLDQTAPEFISYSLSQDGTALYDSAPVQGGLYFPTKGMLTFGNYFNNTVNVTVKFKDTTSGLSTLKYGLYGEEAGTRTALFGSTDEDGYAVATFEICKGVVEQAGIIPFYATDIAGNEGTTLTLQRDGTYEWSVETTGPVIDSFFIKTGEKQLEYVVSGSEEYYSKCNAVVNVSDTVSGIYSIAWDVNGNRYEEERVGNISAKQTSWVFDKAINNSNFPSESGKYSVYAVITDNAGNEIKTDTIQFKVDDEMPVIEEGNSDYDTWQTKVKVEFDTYDELSGLKYINVTDADGNLIEHHVEEVKDGVSYCYFETVKKGTYHIIVSDKAGNINTKEITITKVSNVTPECPTVTIVPKEANGNNGWYTTIPSAVIDYVTSTSDDTPVATKYQLWEDGDNVYNETTLSDTATSQTITIPGEGIYNLKTWSESATGIRCAEQHEYQVKVDTISPKIDFTTTKGSGSSIVVNYTVTDSGSGVDEASIKILHGTKTIPAKLEETENGYTGSFIVSATGDYIIQATDLAGNVADEAAFTPMSMKVKAVTNISDEAATISANIIKGTFDITGATISYREIKDETYTEVDTIVSPDEDTGNIALSAILSGLSEETVYAYKITAVSAAGEVLEYEGYFRTLSLSETGITVTGTARYANNAEGTVTVSLYEGNVCSRSIEINAGEEFVFNNVPDGNYSIVATDGVYSKTKRVLIKDGLIIYPEKYIDLVLSGKNTSVVITTADTPNVTADNMDSIFDYDVINFTDDDITLIETGGTVEFKLYATLMSVSNVSASEISAMYAVTDKNKIVGAYLDLSLYKIVTNSNGEVERTRVTELANGADVSVTIPLGELSGKPDLEVIRIHDTGDSNYLGASLVDQDNNPSTYTISTNQFSTYAVLYSRESASTTETMEDDDTTTAPTTEDKNIYTTTEDNSVHPATEDGNGSGSEKAIVSKVSKVKYLTNSSVGSLRSSGSAKTGDETPVAVMGFMTLITTVGFFVLRKKSYTEK